MMIFVKVMCNMIICLKFIEVIKNFHLSLTKNDNFCVVKYHFYSINMENKKKERKNTLGTDSDHS